MSRHLLVLRADRLGKAKAIYQKAETENRLLTDDEQKQALEFKSEADKAEQQFVASEGIEKLNESLGREVGVKPPSAYAQREIPVALSGNIRTGLRDALTLKDKMENARGKVYHATNAREAFQFGMFILGIVGLSQGNQYYAQQCAELGIPLVFDGSQPGMASPMKESSNQDGGYFVPEEASTRLIDLREKFGVARDMCYVEPMGSDTKTITRRRSGVTGYWIGEMVAAVSSKGTWDRVGLNAKKNGAIVIMSRELSEDAVVSIGDKMMGEIAYAFAQMEDDSYLNGDGTANMGKITGLITRLQDCDGAGTDSHGVVAGSGNAWSALTLLDFHKVIGRLPEYADGDSVRWAVHRTFYYEVMQKLAFAAGGVTATEIIDGRRVERFLGYPVKFVQKMPRTSASAHIPALLGNFPLASTFGDRKSLTIDVTKEATVDGLNLWELEAMAMKGTQRIDIVNHDVGDASNAGPVVALATT